MPLAQAKCKNCGAVLEVDTSMETAVCPYCGTPYIVEKTIKNYNANFNITNQIRTDTVNIYGGSASARSAWTIAGDYLLRYNGSERDVTIPSSVRIIKKDAFRGNPYIFTVSMPSSVEEIEARAFSDCLNLRKVVVGEGVRKCVAPYYSECPNLAQENFVLNDFLKQELAAKEIAEQERAVEETRQLQQREELLKKRQEEFELAKKRTEIAHKRAKLVDIFLLIPVFIALFLLLRNHYSLWLSLAVYAVTFVLLLVSIRLNQGPEKHGVAGLVIVAISIIIVHWVLFASMNGDTKLTIMDFGMIVLSIVYPVVRCKVYHNIR